MRHGSQGDRSIRSRSHAAFADKVRKKIGAPSELGPNSDAPLDSAARAEKPKVSRLFIEPGRENASV